MFSKETVKVFDTSLYSDLPEYFQLPTLTEDLAGIVIEAGKRPLEERINPRILTIAGDKVVDPKTNSPVELEFAFTNELQKQECTAASLFYDYLKESPGNLVMTLSPSGGPAKYKEARINVGYRMQNQIEFYGIPSNLDPDTLLQYATQLTEWNLEPYELTEFEDLREIAFPLKLPPGENPWLFLDKVAPLDSKAWQAIYEGNPWLIKRAAEKDALLVASEMIYQLQTAQTESDFIQVGAWGENKMAEKGWDLNALACPGFFNTQLLQENLKSPYIKDIFGNVRRAADKSQFVKKCPYCHKNINSVIHPGYTCSCGETYEGVC